MSQTVQLFPLGQIVATPGALAALEQAGQSAHELLTSTCTGNGASLMQTTGAKMNSRSAKASGCSPRIVSPLARSCGSSRKRIVPPPPCYSPTNTNKE